MLISLSRPSRPIHVRHINVFVPVLLPLSDWFLFAHLRSRAVQRHAVWFHVGQPLAAALQLLQPEWRDVGQFINVDVTAATAAATAAAETFVPTANDDRVSLVIALADSLR